MTPDNPVQAPPSDKSAVEEPAGAEQPPVRTEAPILPRWLALATLGVLVLFVVVQGSILAREWFSLRTELQTVSDTVVVGYLNIMVNPSCAERPENWFHDDGEHTLIWAGWKHNVGHGWFRVGRGEVDQTKISARFGRDVLQAIDYPLAEISGGTIWSRVPASAQVFGVEVGELPSVYPLRLLDKVEVVNDQVGDRPLLVTFSPLLRIDQSVRVYDPVLDGRRLTMGLSGYFQDRSPLLYDRGTESLWIDSEKGLSAIAGSLKGSVLRAISRPVPAALE